MPYCGITREASRITTAILITIAKKKKNTGRSLIHGPFIDYNDNNNNDNNNNEEKHDHKRK